MSSVEVGVTLAKTIGLSTAGFCLGMVASFNYLWIPTLLASKDASDKVIMQQWRTGYVIGYRLVTVQWPICALSFGYLAYHSPNHPQRILYTLSTLLLPSIIPFTLTIQRPTNGALCLRAAKLAGAGSGTVAETYGLRNEKASEMEKGMGTRELVEAWRGCNFWRVMLLVAGVVAGAVGVVVGG